jgi:hypothetical protein
MGSLNSILLPENLLAEQNAHGAAALFQQPHLSPPDGDLPSGLAPLHHLDKLSRLALLLDPLRGDSKIARDLLNGAVKHTKFLQFDQVDGSILLACARAVVAQAEMEIELVPWHDPLQPFHPVHKPTFHELLPATLPNASRRALLLELFLNHGSDADGSPLHRDSFAIVSFL